MAGCAVCGEPFTRQLEPVYRGARGLCLGCSRDFDDGHKVRQASLPGFSVKAQAAKPTIVHRDIKPSKTVPSDPRAAKVVRCARCGATERACWPDLPVEWRVVDDKLFCHLCPSEVRSKATERLQLDRYDYASIRFMTVFLLHPGYTDDLVAAERAKNAAKVLGRVLGW